MCERERARRFNRVASGKRISLQHAVTVARISGMEKEIQAGRRGCGAQCEGSTR
ncbi:MAG TPA: hypothetical protein VF510_00440 [Ktedonobacterales bacterium]